MQKRPRALAAMRGHDMPHDGTLRLARLGIAALAESERDIGPLTVFAPSDSAFAALPQNTIRRFLAPENREWLMGVIVHHVLSGRLMLSQIAEAGRATTVGGGALEFAVEDGTVTVDGARVTAWDIETRNGLIHIIDRVLMPADRTFPTV